MIASINDCSIVSDTFYRRRIFQGHFTFGSIDISEKSQITDIWADLQGRINSASNPGEFICFNPRHGIRAYNGEEHIDYLICFQCLRLYIYEGTDGKLTRLLLEGERENKLLNNILDKAGINRDTPKRP